MKTFFFVGLIFFGSSSPAYELYDKKTQRLYGVKWCKPSDGLAGKEVSYINCDAPNEEPEKAELGSICSNLNNGCSHDSEALPPILNESPWNFYNAKIPANSNQPQHYTPPPEMQRSIPTSDKKK